MYHVSATRSVCRAKQGLVPCRPAAALRVHGPALRVHGPAGQQHTHAHARSRRRCQRHPALRARCYRLPPASAERDCGDTVTTTTGGRPAAADAPPPACPACPATPSVAPPGPCCPWGPAPTAADPAALSRARNSSLLCCCSSTVSALVMQPLHARQSCRDTCGARPGRHQLARNSGGPWSCWRVGLLVPRAGDRPCREGS